MKHVALIAASVAALMAGTALAHTELKATLPANAATMAKAPDHVELSFSEPVRLTALAIQKDGQQKQSLGPLPAETTANLHVPLPSMMDDGHYVITWRAMSEDTHVMSGEFMFAVGMATGHDQQMNHAAGQGDDQHAMPAGEHHDDHEGAH